MPTMVNSMANGMTAAVISEGVGGLAFAAASAGDVIWAPATHPMAPAPTEAVEALEQLRALWHGHRIAVHLTDTAPGPGVDTPQDLERVRRLLAG